MQRPSMSSSAPVITSMPRREPGCEDYRPERIIRTCKKKFRSTGCCCIAGPNGDGKPAHRNTGPAHQEAMETADGGVHEEAQALHKEAWLNGEPFFVWFNTRHIDTSAPMPVPGRWASQGVGLIGITRRVMIYHDTASVRCWIWWMSCGNHRRTRS